jgi:hypothetical protein
MTYGTAVEETLTAAERAAPFAIAGGDVSPLPKRTREPVIVEGDAISIIDPKTGEVVALQFVDDEGGGP